MMFGWDREDEDAVQVPRAKPNPMAWVILAVCLAPPLLGLVFLVAKVLTPH